MINCRNTTVISDLKSLYDTNSCWSMLKEKNILITGATGMLATYCCYFLSFLNDTYNFGIKITALVRNEEKAKKKFQDIYEKDYFTLLVQDIKDPLSIDTHFDYILHMSGSASAYAITHEPENIIISNVLGTKNVLDLAVKCKNTRVLFTSTREVYGRLDDGIASISENMMGVLDVSSSRSCYPESKRMAENLLAVYKEKYHIDYVNVRLAHAYGPGMALKNDGRVMADLISDAANGKDIILKSDGIMKRAFCYISDAISAIFTILLIGKSGESYNISNEKEEISIKDLAFLIASLSNQNLKVTFKKITPKEQKGYLSIERVKLNTDKLEHLGWKPLVGLEEGIKRTLQSLKAR